MSNRRTEYLKLLQIVVLNIRQLMRFTADFDIWNILIGTLYGSNGAFFTLHNLCKYLSVLFGKTADMQVIARLYIFNCKLRLFIKIFALVDKVGGKALHQIPT